MGTKEYRKWVSNNSKPVKVKALVVYVNKGNLTRTEVVDIKI